MATADYIQLPADAAGKKLDTASVDLLDGRGTTHKQRVWVEGEVADGASFVGLRPVVIAHATLSSAKVRAPAVVGRGSGRYNAYSQLVLPDATNWTQTVQGSSNAITTATQAAVANEWHAMTVAAFSFLGGAPTAPVRFQILRGAVVIYEIASVTPMHLQFAIPLDGQEVAMSGVLAAPGVSISGLVSIGGIAYPTNL